MFKELNERNHAYIVADFYRYLRDSSVENWKDIFIFATRTYGEERGRRMAQRALRDGEALDFRNYKRYSEWSPTKEMETEGHSNKSQDLSFIPDYSYKVLRCPWAYQFSQMDLKDCGAVYCRYIDKAIVRGFNPELEFEVPVNLNEEDHCIQVMKNACLDKDNMPKGNKNDQEPFSYHCAHVFYSFSKVLQSVLKEKGEWISLKVKEDFAREYGNEALAQLMSYAFTDFTVLLAGKPTTLVVG